MINVEAKLRLADLQVRLCRAFTKQVQDGVRPIREQAMATVDFLKYKKRRAHKLPKSQRPRYEYWRMNKLDGMSASEIAKIKGIAKGAVYGNINAVEHEISRSVGNKYKRENLMKCLFPVPDDKKW